MCTETQAYLYELNVEMKTFSNLIWYSWSRFSFYHLLSSSFSFFLFLSYFFLHTYRLYIYSIHICMLTLPEKSLYYEPHWKMKEMCVRQIILIFRLWNFHPSHFFCFFICLSLLLFFTLSLSFFIFILCSFSLW